MHALFPRPLPARSGPAAVSSTDRQDLSARPGAICTRVLLLWGDADPISPVAVGQRLASPLPSSALHVIPGGTRDLASHLAAVVAPLIDAPRSTSMHSRQ
ncbi:alpha/beta fold hydrolase [Massilia sp. TSP1-1-2]|uniref:alpha/beta fold hydrolase n=1 Tax=Massilia sp. TSP1-1-2 TaxID=2804649 RepID=UPI003CE69382